MKRTQEVLPDISTSAANTRWRTVRLEKRPEVSVLAVRLREAVPLRMDSPMWFYDTHEVQNLARVAEGSSAA